MVRGDVESWVWFKVSSAKNSLTTNSMCASLKRLESMSISTKHLINGYIRLCQNKLFNDSIRNQAYYNIPALIYTYCILYYDTLTWYKNKHGNNLEFISDTEVKSNDVDYAAICMFENEISNEFCDTFSITFKMKSGAIRTKMNAPFLIGYSTGNSLEKSIIDWNKPLGGIMNKDTRSFCVGSFLAYFENGRSDLMPEFIRYSVGDLIKLLFDFKDKKVNVYQNDKSLGHQDLDVEKLWVGLCLTKPDTIIQMIAYQYD